ncbi:MAG: ADP-ribosylation factor-like protein [Candidatus Hydrothermae bacterium]|nr:ADP-ribosylation factor-like protein [Candidatus Hydrothermae bacterium]
MIIDPRKKEIRFKIVYYGAAVSGKTTNIKHIHSRYPGPKGDLVTIDTEGERTLVFDFLPIEIEIIKGFKTRFYLYTVPGQFFYKATRKMVLKGADGVIFVVDSSRARLHDNIASFKELVETLKAYGLVRIPIVIQYNKRDLPDAIPLAELQKRLNPYRFPAFEAIAVQGKGVFRTLEAMIKLLVRSFVRRSLAASRQQQQK